MRKLLRENFSGAAPLHGDPAVLLNQVRAHLVGWNGVRDVTGYRAQQKDHELFIDLSDPDGGRDYWRSCTLQISLDPQQGLRVACAGKTTAISAIEEIGAFVRAYQAALRRQRAHQAKRDKLRDLKARAIIAQVRQIAKEDGFDFATETDNIKLKLYIRLKEQDCFRVDIPFNKFQELLPKLRTSTQSIRELYASGIRFRLGRLGSWVHWIDHRTIDND